MTGALPCSPRDSQYHLRGDFYPGLRLIHAHHTKAGPYLSGRELGELAPVVAVDVSANLEWGSVCPQQEARPPLLT
jgi:hypothetical protein